MMLFYSRLRDLEETMGHESAAKFALETRRYDAEHIHDLIQAGAMAFDPNKTPCMFPPGEYVWMEWTTGVWGIEANSGVRRTFSQANVAMFASVLEKREPDEYLVLTSEDIILQAALAIKHQVYGKNEPSHDGPVVDMLKAKVREVFPPRAKHLYDTRRINPQELMFIDVITSEKRVAGLNMILPLTSRGAPIMPGMFAWAVNGNRVFGIDWDKDTQYITSPGLQLLALVNASNVPVEEYREPKRPRKVRPRGTPPVPRLSFNRVRFNPLAPKRQGPRDTNPDRENKGIMPLHFCPGHFKDYRLPNKPLFGKYHGVWYWHTFLRGSISAGYSETEKVVATDGQRRKLEEHLSFEVKEVVT